MTKEYTATFQETNHLQLDILVADQTIVYQPMPDPAETPYVWRVHFDVMSKPGERFGLDIQGELMLGRDVNHGKGIDLNGYDGAGQGVSRHHALLRPTSTNLFLIDLGSTNGTTRNGRSIGVNTPYPLVNGDVISLGDMQLAVHIVKRPSLQGQTTQLNKTPDLTDALSQIAKSITSQLDVDEVLNQVAEMAMLLTAAGEAGIWLVDEKTGELFLEAQRGIEDEGLRRTRLPIREDTLAGKVIQSGRPLRTSRKEDGDPIKVKTNYLVEALVYVPIKLGGVTLGVISAVHRLPGKQFERRDERLLEAIADFTAIAIQNARLYQATDQALARRVKELGALNELSHTVSASLDLKEVYKVLSEQVKKNWQVKKLALYLRDNKGNKFRAVSLNSHASEEVITQGHILWQAAQEQQPLVANQLQENPDYQDSTKGLAGQRIDSVACVPLVIQDEVVGLLVLFDKVDGDFLDEDTERLQAFANPVATAVKNARLFAESERQRRAIQATAQALSQPLLILDDNGEVLVANEAAQHLLKEFMSPLFEGISRGAGRTVEMKIGEHTYLTTTQHLANVGTIIVMQDITYVKQLEQDRADFMNVLSHDLKSPLTSISGYAQLLLKFIDLDSKSTSYLQRIVDASERMLGMINRLLQIAKGDSVELERVPCKLDEIVAQVVQDVEGSALNKSIKVHSTVKAKPVPIYGDPMRLYHLALNLVENAVKYSPVETAVSVQLIYKPQSVILRVADEGPGIPEKDLSRVFDKYYRGTQAKQQPGAGLGLSVVWAITEAHGGRATVQNGEKGGAVFTIMLPIGTDKQ